MANLPVELVHKICLDLLPPSLVALSQSNKMLHDFLSRQTFTSNEIWKNSREMCNPAVPPPPPNWSECSYAQFIFGSNPCEICGKATERFPVSLSIRLKICDKSECRDIAFSDKDIVYIKTCGLPEIITHSMLWVESNARTGLKLPRGHTIRARVNAALLEYNQMVARVSTKELLEVYDKRADQRRKIMAAAHDFIEWRDGMRKHGARARWRTEYELTKLAKEFEWKHIHMLCHPIGSAYMHISAQTGVHIAQREWTYVECAARPKQCTKTRELVRENYVKHTQLKCRHCLSTKRFSFDGMKSHARNAHHILGSNFGEADFELAAETWL